ncbi:MAG: hypothetical protein L0Z50_05535 [Verrucomicrobiales bacterium]|nr:hypothetical protein [Verrucomicrobiales bacterium]
MKRVHWLSGAIACCGLIFSAPETCGATLAGPLDFKGHRYFLLTGSNWLDAESEAQSMGGHLVTINDAEEEQWLIAAFATWDGIERSLWMGFNDRATEGQFEWASGEPVTYTNWDNGEPNNNATSEGEDCAHIWPLSYGNGGKWNDLAYWTEPFDRDGRLVILHGVVEVARVPESGRTDLLVAFAFAAMALTPRGEKRGRP